MFRRGGLATQADYPYEGINNFCRKDVGDQGFKGGWLGGWEGAAELVRGWLLLVGWVGAAGWEVGKQGTILACVAPPPVLTAGLPQLSACCRPLGAGGGRGGGTEGGAASQGAHGRLE